MAANNLAYGFINLEHLMGQRVADTGTAIINQAVLESAAEYTRSVNAQIASMVERTTLAQERFLLPGSGTLQPLDEDGNPLPIAEGGYYTVAYPIQGGGTAWGTNRVTRALMTVEEANRQTVEAMKRDSDWMRRHILSAMLDNTTWVYDDKLYGNLTVQPLANGDSVVYNRIGGAPATDDHYLAQAAAISDVANPFPTIYNELFEHPGNSGPFVVYTASDQVSAIQALTGFIPVSDPDIQAAITTDNLRSVISRGLGDEVLGKIDRCWVVEWRAMPSGYMLAHAQGAGPIVKMREYPTPGLQGLFTEMDDADGNHMAQRMLRYAGFGVANRVAAVVQYIGGGAYVIPTNYTNPLVV